MESVEQKNTVTLKSELMYGIDYAGKNHREFEIRLPTIADNLAALDEAGEKSQLYVDMVLFAKILVRVGDIPAEAINVDLVTNHVIDDDFNILRQALVELRKKRLSASKN